MLSAIVLLVLLLGALAVARAAWIVSGWADIRRHRGDDAPAPLDLPLVEDATAGAPAIHVHGRRRGSAVVLVHGICGFDALALGPVRIEYFRGVARHLVGAGADVEVARMPPLGAVPARAAALARLIERLPHDRVVLVAHSMGGLDARWALAHEGLADRAAALVTIGTPHRGTPIADLLARGPQARARALLGRIGLPSDAIEWLTTAGAARITAAAPDLPGVRYASIVTATADRARVHPLLRVPHAYLARKGAGPSDGLVPASSQPWGEVLAEGELDHWAQVGWTGLAMGWPGAPRHDPAALVEHALRRLVALPAPPVRRALTASASV